LIEGWEEYLDGQTEAEEFGKVYDFFVHLKWVSSKKKYYECLKSKMLAVPSIRFTFVNQ